MRTIVEMKLAQVVRRLRQHYGLETEINDSLYDALTAACLLPDTGARNIDSLLNQQILPVLSQQLLAQQARTISQPNYGLAGMRKTGLYWSSLRKRCNNGGCHGYSEFRPRTPQA